MNKIKTQLEPAKQNSPPPLLYIPVSDHKAPDSTNLGHYNTLNLQIDHSPSSHNSGPPAILYQQLEESQRHGYTIASSPGSTQLFNVGR